MSWSKMGDVPNPIFDTNGDPYSGAVLKAYLPGTTTSTSIAINSSGGSLQTSITANADGIWEVSGNEIVPHIDRKHKWGIFANSTDATANTPFYMGPFDNIFQTSEVGGSVSGSKNVTTTTVMTADTSAVVGDVFITAEYSTGNNGGGTYDVVLTSGVTPNAQNIIVGVADADISFELRVDGEILVDQLGAKEGATFDNAPIITKALTLSDNIVFDGRKIYGVKAQLTFPGEKVYNGNSCTLKAITGFTASEAIISIRNVSEIRVSDFTIDGNNLAEECINTFHMNETSSTISNVICTNAIGPGMLNSGSQASMLINVDCRVNGTHGFVNESCNAMNMIGCGAASNANGHGVLVRRGVIDGFSGGMDIQGGIYQNNLLGNGIFVEDTTTPVKIRGAWIEGNGNGPGAGANLAQIRVGGAGTNTVADIEGNLIIQALGSKSDGTDYAIAFLNGGTGRAENNYLSNSGLLSGSIRNKVFIFDTDTEIRAEFNTNTNDGAKADPVYNSAGELDQSVIHDTEFFYQALKLFSTGTDTVTYYKILTAPTQSSVEVVISGAGTNAGGEENWVVYTWSTMGNATRRSFAEVGGGTNPHTERTYYLPVADVTKAPFVRWNGNDLEIKLQSTASEKMIVEVKLKRPFKAKIITWII